MKVLFSGYGREFCSRFTGHDKTAPPWSNPDCPLCGQRWTLDSRIIVIEHNELDNPVVYHTLCYTPVILAQTFSQIRRGLLQAAKACERAAGLVGFLDS